MENNTTKVAQTAAPKAAIKLDFDIPSVKDFLKTGVQFGHQTNRWNPKMAKYIFGAKGGVHIIDVSKTMPLLDKALKFLVDAASKGSVLFVATKKQASEIVRREAINSGSYFITHRWPGGFFTNKDMIRRSLKKLQKLEEDFEKGVEGRTKYEVSMMKKEWTRLNRLYEGVKTIEQLPKAVVVIDTNFERKAVKESLASGVPVVAILDTNCDPEGIQYPIPANDDAVKSIDVIAGLIGKAIKQGNQGKGVQFNDVDYSKVEVKIIKPATSESDEAEAVEVASEKSEKPQAEAMTTKPARKRKAVKKEEREDEEKGLLGKARERSTKARAKISTEEAPKKKAAAKVEKKKVEKKKTAKKKSKK